MNRSHEHLDIWIQESRRELIGPGHRCFVGEPRVPARVYSYCEQYRIRALEPCECLQACVSVRPVSKLTS